MKSIIRIFVVCAAVLVSISAHADNVTFNYQGRVKVSGTPFTGTGQFKFSILNTPGTAVLWTNDGTTPAPNVAPTTAVPLPVADGLFSAEIGSIDLGMEPINSLLFSSLTPLRLRVWFDSGAGEQQLTPDYKLMDITFNTVQTGTGSNYLYVDAVNGNNSNNGLTTTTAKQTIQAAVDLIPGRVLGNMTVKVFPGIYREQVRIAGINATGAPFASGWDGPSITLLGDESWTTASAGSPSVRVTGTDNDISLIPSRIYGISATNCAALEIRGVLVDYTASNGVRLRTGTYIVRNCKLSNNTGAGLGIDAAVASVIGCTASNNTGYGMGMINGRAWFEDCHTKSNTIANIQIIGPAWASVNRGIHELSPIGLEGWGKLDFHFGAALIRDNAKGIQLTADAAGHNVVSCTFSNNTQNTFLSMNGTIYY